MGCVCSYICVNYLCKKSEKYTILQYFKSTNCSYLFKTQPISKSFFLFLIFNSNFQTKKMTVFWKIIE